MRLRTLAWLVPAALFLACRSRDPHGGTPSASALTPSTWPKDVPSELSLEDVPPGIGSLETTVHGGFGATIYISPDVVYAAHSRSMSFATAREIQSAGGVLVASIIRKVWNRRTQTYDRVGDDHFAAIAAWANANEVVIADDCSSPLPPVEHLRCTSQLWRPDEVWALRSLRSLALLTQMLDNHDLQGLAELGRLERLDISGNQVQDLSPLLRLTQLRELDVSRNPIDGTTLKPLLAARALESLKVGDITTDWSSADLSKLHTLVVYGSPFSGADLLTVATGAPKLNSLDLSHTAITGRDLPEAVRHLKGLRHLRLEGTDIDGHVAELAQLESLESLDLRFVDVTDEEVTTLAALTKLREVVLSGKTSCSAVADTLAHWPQLESLMWMSSKLDCDPGLSRLPHLRELWLDHSGVHDVFFEDLGKCRALERLSLQHTFVTDEQIEKLVDVRSLNWLSTYETKISASGCDRLNAALGRKPCTPP